MRITPASPSMISRSSWRTRSLATRAPTTAGMSMLRATMAVWLVLPPRSVTKPANTLFLNCSMSAGDSSCATSTSTSTSPSARTARGAASGTGGARPLRRRSTRSTTCSRSALRSRRYSSSISSNWRVSTSSWLTSAHSAL